MMNQVDIEKGLVRVWDDEALDAHFSQYWTTGQSDEFLLLNDTEAPGGQPFPYCNFSVSSGATTSRSSAATTGRANVRIQEIRQHPIQFQIYARNIINVGNAKRVAAAMAEEVMRVYGGHPEYSPKVWDLDHGGILLCQYQNDFGARMPEDEHLWTINYQLTADVPVSV